MVAMHGFAQLCGGAEIGFPGQSNRPTIRYLADRRTLHNRKRLTRIEAEFCIQRERTIVKCRLHQPYPRTRTFVSPVDHRLHQQASHTPILRSRIDRDRSDSCNRGTLIQAIASYNLAVDFCDDAVETGMGEKRLQQTDADFSRRNIGWETMLFVDCGESFITDPTAKVCILARGQT